jgi:hypothetical protein
VIRSSWPILANQKMEKSDHVRRKLLGGELGEVERYLKAGWDPNSMIRRRGFMASVCDEPVFFACHSQKTIELFVKYGADLRLRDSDGGTIVMNAICDDAPQILDYLYSQVPDLFDARDNTGWTALMYATNRFSPRDNIIYVLQYLINKGVNLDSRTQGGKRAIDFAHESYEYRILLHAMLKTNVPIGSIPGSFKFIYDQELKKLAIYTIGMVGKIIPATVLRKISDYI